MFSRLAQGIIDKFLLRYACSSPNREWANAQALYSELHVQRAGVTRQRLSHHCETPSLQSHPVQQRLQLRQVGGSRLKTQTGGPVNSPWGRETFSFQLAGSLAQQQTVKRLTVGTSIVSRRHQPSSRVQLTAVLVHRQSRWPVRAVRRSTRRSPLSLLSQRLIPVVKIHSCGTQHMLFPREAAHRRDYWCLSFGAPSRAHSSAGNSLVSISGSSGIRDSDAAKPKANGADRLEDAHLQDPEVC